MMILAKPSKGYMVADVGEYDGPPDPEEMIKNKSFVEWDGKVARHFVPVDYYKRFMLPESVALYEDMFDEFDFFAFYEYQEGEDCEFWIDKDNCLKGSWFLLMMEGDNFHWFKTEVEAQALFYWLSSEEIQDKIYDQNQLEGSAFPFSVASKIN